MNQRLFFSFYRFAAACTTSTAFFLALPGAHAAEKPSLDDFSLEYPELLVTPRASERIQREAEIEKQNKWLQHWPIQTSALVTIGAGLAWTPPDDFVSGESFDPRPIAIGVGSAWLVTTIALTLFKKPYQDGWKQISDLPNKSKRDQLTREREAERIIQSAAGLGRRLMWFSIVTQFAASGVVLSEDLGDKTTMAFAGVGMVAAWLPFVFQYRWQDVASEQEMYKKRIYAPVAGPLFQPDSQGRITGAGMQLSFRF